MPLLQPKLNLKVAQRQILTPGLMQMVSVLALNKLELKEMIDAEMVENPVLEEIDETVPMLDDVAGREERLERGAEEAATPPKDIFNEIDFGSYFQEYLDPPQTAWRRSGDGGDPGFGSPARRTSRAVRGRTGLERWRADKNPYPESAASVDRRQIVGAADRVYATGVEPGQRAARRCRAL